MLIIGDVHGKIDEYKKIIATTEKSIQIGDMGFDYPFNHDLNHRFFKGNHDHYGKNSPYDLGDFGIHEGIFFVRGAKTVDKPGRHEGIAIWEYEEQLNYHQMSQAISLCVETRPEIIVSHDCPQALAQILFDIEDASATRQGLQIMLENHQPKLWIFGHHHRWADCILLGTRFICVPELGTFQV